MLTYEINSILVLFLQQLSITSYYFIIVLMSVVSLIHENDNSFPAELTVGIVLPCKKKIRICKLVDPDWWCFHRPNYSVFLYNIPIYSRNETVILDWIIMCLCITRNLLSTYNIQSILLEA